MVKGISPNRIYRDYSKGISVGWMGAFRKRVLEAQEYYGVTEDSCIEDYLSIRLDGASAERDTLYCYFLALSFRALKDSRRLMARGLDKKLAKFLIAADPGQRVLFFRQQTLPMLECIFKSKACTKLVKEMMKVLQ